jgi:TPR repeat protein
LASQWNVSEERIAIRALATDQEGGMGVSQDDIEAAKWYRRAADTGDDIAQYHVGVCTWTAEVCRETLSERTCGWIWRPCAAIGVRLWIEIGSLGQ